MFSSSSFADDIRDFQIEGISLGDSALDYFTEEQIKNNSFDYYKNKEYTPVQTDNFPFFETFDGVDFSYKTNDENYKIYSLNGIILYKTNIKSCYKKMDEIINKLSELFINQKKSTKATWPHPNDKSGESMVTDLYFLFDEGDKVTIACYDFTEAHGSQDHLRVGMRKKEFAVWLRDKAY